MSKFMQVYEPVEEGWGTALNRAVNAGATVASTAGGFKMGFGLATGNVGSLVKGASMVGHAATAGKVAGYVGKGIGIISNMTLKRLLDNPKMKKYLEGQCVKLLKEEQKKDKSITADIPTNVTTLVKRWWHNNDEVGFFSKPNFLQQHDDWIDDLVFDLKVGKFVTTFWYDTSHIDAAVVLFYSKDRDTCVGRRIPAPSDKELKEIFHQEF